MKFPRIDASIVCFALVVVAAIPIATLRSRTYSLGYELGNLKQEERSLRQHNVELKSALARTQRNIRDRFLGNHGTDKEAAVLDLPTQERIINFELKR